MDTKDVVTQEKKRAEEHKKTENKLVKKQSKTKLYTYDEAFECSLQYFNGDELAARVFINKYALKDSDGKLYEATPDDMHRRLAKEIARIEKNYPNPIEEEEIFQLLKGFKYIVPQGGPMSGIGNKKQIASLSNCFVIGNEGKADSYGGIMKIDQEQVQLMKRRGGVGHDLSHIRPKGMPVLNSALTSTGVVPFMERYSNSTREVAQDGRRGALILTISTKHPDAEGFIDAKLSEGKVTGANVSVKIDNEFMDAVVNNKTYVQQYPIDAEKPMYTKEVNARKLWEKIYKNAWKSAEPGILFWDTVTSESIPDCYKKYGFETTATNPCGEIPLCPYDSCRLLAINLYSYVEQPFTSKAKFNFDLFKKHVSYAQRIMDDIIDLELEKIDNILEKITSDPEDEEIKRVERKLWEKIKIKAIEGRRTGIGITGEGDMLAGLNLRYGEENAIDFSEEVQSTLALQAYRSSVDLAKERGSFEIYDPQLEKENPFINRLKERDSSLYNDMIKHGRRNIALLTIAPTGTTSLMTQTTSGIEPIFSPVYKRRRKVNPNDPNVNAVFTDEIGDTWEEYNVFHHKFIDWLKINEYNIDDVKQYDDTAIDELVKQSPYYQATSQTVNWINKVKMQGRIQQWVDHSISVTINLPKDASEELVGELYVTAWKSGCKGVTVYREGSRSGVLISGKKEKQNQEGQILKPKKRPTVLDAEIIRFKNNQEEWIAFVGLNNGHPYEIFTGIADEEMFPIPKSIKKGKIIKVKENENARYDFQYTDKYGYKNTLGGLSHVFNKEYWNYAKMISFVLRYGMPLPDVVNIVTSLHLDNEVINNWINGVSRALKKYIPDGTKAKTGSKCNECGSENLVYQEGCLFCKNCGFSKCG